ncbi:hypothetical protein, partial [Mycobacterium tuberculosis]
PEQLELVVAYLLFGHDNILGRPLCWLASAVLTIGQFFNLGNLGRDVLVRYQLQKLYVVSVHSLYL